MMFTHFFKFYNSCKGASSHSKQEEQVQNETTARNFLTINTPNPHNKQISKQELIIRLQYGRSMVEMLGVLAIIGVLSVGGISGYSKAMMKYKLNKQAGQISTLINAGLRYAGKWDFKDSQVTTPLFIKLGEIPKEMIHSNITHSVFDVFGTSFSYDYTVNTTNNTKYTQLFIFLDTSKTDEYKLSSCRNIITSAKEFHDNISTVETLNSDTEDGAWDYSYLVGDKKCTQNHTCLKDITISQIDNFCRYNAGKTKEVHMKIIWEE